MDGDDVGTIYWGDTREEVYEQCKETIDRYWKEEYSEYGTPQELFIKSVAFVEAKLSDNKKLMQSDPTYLANLANQSEEQRARDLDGNWKYKSVGDDLIKLNMEKFFKNDIPSWRRNKRCSCDVAFDGGDNLVLWLWIGNHIQDIFTCSKNSKIVMQTVKNKLEEWRVLEEDFTYDLSGIGQSFKGFFPNAIPFNNRESVEEKVQRAIRQHKVSMCISFLSRT
jgi:activator of HSP90 ATPase